MGMFPERYLKVTPKKLPEQEPLENTTGRCLYYIYTFIYSFVCCLSELQRPVWLEKEAIQELREAGNCLQVI